MSKVRLENYNPTVCVPIIAESANDIIEQAKQLIEENVKVIEVRLDFFEKLSDKEALRNCLSELAKLMKDTLFIATIRTKAEGGQCDYDEEAMIECLTFISECQAADYIDVEYFTYANPQELINTIKGNGASVIASHHEFDSTPSCDIMKDMLSKMGESDTDIVKLAVMPTNREDVLNLMRVSNEFGEQSDKLLITMSMGDLGKVTRIAGNVTGSCLTFGSKGVGSAPGQVEFNLLTQILKNMN